MGTPLPANEPGELCLSCWGLDRPLAPGPTPRVVTVQLSGLQPGEFFPLVDEQLLLSPHSLLQAPDPCEFKINDGLFDWLWLFSFAEPTIIVTIPAPLRFAFLGRSLIPCSLEIPNQLTNPAGTLTFGGVATVTWALEGL